MDHAMTPWVSVSEPKIFNSFVDSNFELIENCLWSLSLATSTSASLNLDGLLDSVGYLFNAHSPSDV